MSVHYTNATAKADSKITSRIKIAEVLKCYTGKNAIHHLGGRIVETPFEDLFGASKDVTFYRYEHGNDAQVPNNYVDLLTFENKADDLKYGYFINGDFWKWMPLTDACQKAGTTRHYWVDLCGMPQPNILANLKAYFDKDTIKGEVFVTFFMNPRMRKDIQEIMNKKGIDLISKSESLCEHLNEMFQVRKWEVFDMYINDHSPMAVFRMKNESGFMSTTQQQPVVKQKKETKKHSAEQYAVECKRFSNKQLAILWKKSTMQIAGYAAQAKRKGLLTAAA